MVILTRSGARIELFRFPSSSHSTLEEFEIIAK